MCVYLYTSYWMIYRIYTHISYNIWWFTVHYILHRTKKSFVWWGVSRGQCSFSSCSIFYVLDAKAHTIWYIVRYTDRTIKYWFHTSSYFRFSDILMLPFAQVHEDLIKSFSALPALCEGNPPVTSGFTSQRPVTRGFHVFDNRYLNTRLNKQSKRRWYETTSRWLWRHCNGMIPSVCEI